MGATSIELLKEKILELLYVGHDVEQVVNEVLALLGNYFDVSRVYIFESTEDGKACNNTFEWCNKGVEPCISMLQNLDYQDDLDGTWPRVFNERGIFYCPDINTLEPNTKRVLEVQTIKGVLHCAILENGEFKGFIGFDNCAEIEPAWMTDEPSVEALIYVSRLITIYLLEQRNKHKLLQRKQELETINNQVLGAIAGGIGIVSIEGENLEALYVSPGLANLTGRTVEETYAWLNYGLNEATIYKDDLVKAKNIILEAVNKSEPFDAIYRLIHKSGKLIWVQLNAKMMREENGKKVYYAVYTTPAEEIGLYQSIVDDSSTAVVVAEKGTRKILFNNNAWRNLEQLGSETPCMGKTFKELQLDKYYLFTEEEIDKLPMDHCIEVHKQRCDGKYLSAFARTIIWNGLEAYAVYLTDETELEISRNNLVKEKDKYQHLLDVLPVGIASFDIINHTTASVSYLNEAISTISGYSREELLSHDFDKICEAIAEDKPQVVQKAYEILSKHTTGEVEYSTRTKNGELRSLRSILTAEKTGEEQSTVYVAFMDITMEKQAQSAINTEFEYLKGVQGKNLLGRCRANVSKNFVDNYSADEKITIDKNTMSYTAVMAQIADSCISSEMRKEILSKTTPEVLQHNFAEGINEFSFEYMRLMQDGTTRWVNTKGRILLNPVTGHLMCFLYTYDIDEEFTSKLIINHVTKTEFDMMGLINLSTHILHCVRSADLEEALNATMDIDYTVNMPRFVDAFVAADKIAEMQEKLDLDTIVKELAKHNLYSLTGKVQFQGKEYYKKWEFAYLDEEHEVIVFTRADVTDLFKEQEVQRENLRNALIQAEEANQAKTNFLSRMSHEIRTPMNAIIGMTALATQFVNQPEQVLDCLGKVGLSACFLLALINDILDMSRIKSGKMTVKQEKFPFEELMHSINSLFSEQAREKGIDYDCILATFVDDYYVGDYMKLQQIMINLLSNAIKFTPVGGKVQFIVRRERVENNKAYMCFSVNDTGIGMSSEFQKTMFDPFAQEDSTITTPYKGTGLGLAIAKNFITLMQGTISVNSIEGVGTEFIVRIPLGQCEEVVKYRKLQLDVPMQKLMTLIVDDDVSICHHTQDILKEMGLKAQWVDSGLQAVELVKTKFAQQEVFDVILLDWKMPDLDGIATTRAIRSVVGPHVTIIVMTAYDWTDIEIEARQAGVNMFVTKPLFKSTLQSVYEKAFQHKYTNELAKQKQVFDFTGRRILLVEDHIINVEVAKRLLESKHAEVEVAENGLRAIEMFMAAPDNYYAMILMDIRMPVMDGLTAAKSIRQLHKTGAATVPIVAMSANAFDEDIEKSKAAGMNEHLSKPIEAKILYNAVEKYTHRA